MVLDPATTINWFLEVPLDLAASKDWGILETLRIPAISKTGYLETCHFKTIFECGFDWAASTKNWRHLQINYVVVRWFCSHEEL